MTQDIIEMARDTANHGTHVSGEIIYTFYLEQIEAFAKLVAAKATAKEREACTEAAIKAAEKAIDVAIALEREACAKVCDARAIEYDGFTEEQNASEKLAAAIRARGEQA